MNVPVLFVLLPNVLMLDLAGPAEVLRLATQVEDSTAVEFDLQYVSPVETLQTSIGLPLTGLAPLPPTLAPGTLVVLVGSTSKVSKAGQQAFEAASSVLTQWLQAVFAPSGEKLVCVCAGALSAARAGLLDANAPRTTRCAPLCKPWRPRLEYWKTACTSPMATSVAAPASLPAST